MSSKSSKYELQSPQWLNEAFFEKILRKFLNNSDIKVTNLSIAPATPTNDHYGSIMFRAKIQYLESKTNQSSVPFIVKIAPEMESVKKDILSDSFIFKTEIRMYSETIPKMEKILQKYGDNTILGPNLVYAAMEPNQIIVLEDLIPKGFHSLSRKYPSYEEINRVMSKIAKWHAVSYKLAQEEPESITTYTDCGGFNLNLEKMDIFTSGISNFISNVLSMDEELKKYIPYFEEIDKTLISSCKRIGNAYKLGDKAIFVLNHGDFHFKNMMFRHKDSGELDEILLIDFQMCSYGPAVFDLYYALYMLMDGETRWNKREEIIYDYFCQFQKTLKLTEFKGDIPKMVDLQIDFLKYRKLEVIFVAMYLPLLMAFNDEDFELDKIIESPESRTKLYKHPRFMQEVKRTLPRLLYKGSLE